MANICSRDPIRLAVISSLPLFFGVSGIRDAFFLSGAVLIPACIFEILFFVTKRLWLKSILPLVILIVLSSVLAGVLLVSKAFVAELKFPVTALIPFALPGAFLLASYSSANKPGLGRALIRSWALLTIILWVIGLSRWSSSALRAFPPASFWVVGLTLAVCFGRRKKEAS